MWRGDQDFWPIPGCAIYWVCIRSVLYLPNVCCAALYNLLCSVLCFVQCTVLCKHRQQLSPAQPILASPAQPLHYSLVSTERSDPLCGSTSDISDKCGHE